MTQYIHNINPVLIPLPGPLAIRWYGISYLVGFVAGILLLRRWSRRREFDVPVEEVSNFIVMLGFFGVFLGGRLGYALFYDPELFLDFSPIHLFGFGVPFWGVFKVWTGGMSSHGGFIGVILFLFWYARKHRHSLWNLSDNLACTASLGFGFGRLANFINGELWGRPTEMPWGVIFPEELGIAYGDYTAAQLQTLVARHELMPRHPSQLYQSCCEGFLVFGIMILLRRTRWGRKPGMLSASYLVLYALARIAMEFFREPDNGEFFVGWISKGQFYSLLMILAALVIFSQRKFLSARHKVLGE